MTTTVICRNAVYDPETGCVSKPCPRCRELWPLTLDYYHHHRRPDGRVRWQSWCRACVAEWARDKRERLKAISAHEA